MVFQRNSEAKKAISLGAVSLVVVAIILIVGFGVFLSTILNTGTTSTSSGSSTSTQSTTPATSTSISPTQSSSNSSSGLRLDLFVAPSNGSVGSLVINVDEYNTLSVANNISLMNEWQYPPTSLNPYDPCGAPSVVGFAVIHGYYNLSNYTKANALTLYNTTFAFTCTTTYVGDYHYLFLPDSNVAIISYSGQTLYNFSTLLSFSTRGYWTGGYGVGVGSATFHDFPQGNYTVLAADEWGKVVLVHFEVSSSGFSSGTSTFTSGTLTAQSSSNPNTSDELVCVSTNYQVLGKESISVQNGTTYTSNVTTFTTSTQTTFTTTTTESETIGYATATTSYSPPSSWSVVSCTYTGAK